MPAIDCQPLDFFLCERKINVLFQLLLFRLCYSQTQCLTDIDVCKLTGRYWPPSLSLILLWGAPQYTKCADASRGLTLVFWTNELQRRKWWKGALSAEEMDWAKVQMPAKHIWEMGSKAIGFMVGKLLRSHLSGIGWDPNGKGKQAQVNLALPFTCSQVC